MKSIPKRMALLLIAFMASFAFSQSQAAPVGDPGLKQTKINAGLSADGLAGLDENQKHQIMDVLDSLGKPLASLEGKKWPRRKQVYLALGTDSTNTEDTVRFELFAFDLSGPRIRLLASGDEPYLLSGKDALVGLDLAAYQIKPNEYAFGVRFKRSRDYAGGGTATLEGVILYRIQAGGFDPILRVTTSYEAELAGEWLDDGTRDRSYSSGTAVIVVKKTKTDGYFDWVLKADNGKTALFKWGGNQYGTEDDDPFPTHDFEIFEDE